MRALLAGLGRVLGVQLALRLGDGLSPRATRALLVLVVVVAGLAPVLAVLTGAIGYGDVWLWLAIEVLTIYAWTMVRLVRTARGSSSDDAAVRGFALPFFALHYGMFALVPFVVGLFIILPWSPVRSPWLTVVVLGGLGFLALGWSVRGLLRDRVPVGLGGYVQAYARMMLAYAALFVPLVAAGQSSASPDQPILPVSEARETTVSVLVLLAKLVLEVLLVLVFTARTGGLSVFGRPVVVRRSPDSAAGA